jgi:hypothetical protein
MAKSVAGERTCHDKRVYRYRSSGSDGLIRALRFDHRCHSQMQRDYQPVMSRLHVHPGREGRKRRCIVVAVKC